MSKKVVAVLFGGMSTEHEVSKVSAATVLTGLSPEKYYVLPVYITKEGKWFLYDGSIDNPNIQWEKHGTPVVLSPDRSHRGFLRIVGDKVKNIPVDIIFPVLHGKNGEDGTIQGLCEMAGIPYVGAGVLSSSACMDKVFTKIVAKSIGVKQADYLVVRKYDFDENMNDIVKKIRYKIGYPCFIKPANAGSSVGITKAKNKDELIEGLLNAARYDKKIVVEKAVAGREFECAVLGNEQQPKASGVGEIIPAEDAEFYTYEAKYNDEGSMTILSPDIETEILEEIRNTSISIYKAMECEGMARVDFFIENETNKIIFNEINTIPGFTTISMYPMLWAASGVSVSELADELIALGFSRNQ